MIIPRRAPNRLIGVVVAALALALLGLAGVVVLGAGGVPASAVTYGHDLRSADVGDTLVGPGAQAGPHSAGPRRGPRHDYDHRSQLAGASARPGGYSVAPRAISAADEIPSSAAQGARLREHLRMADEYGSGGVRELADGRIRYYDQLTPARKPGEMAGGRLAREWDPASGAHRTWFETLDHSGRIRQVHPYQPYSEYHYMFDEFGNYVGRR
jgi:hypothetical protein